MNVNELLSFKPASMTPSREANSGSSSDGAGSRKRPRLPVPSNREDAGILKKAHLSSGIPINIDFSEEMNDENGKGRSDLNSTSEDGGLEISEEERLRILKMVEDEPEVRVLSWMTQR